MTMGEALNSPVSFASAFYKSDAWKARKQEQEAEDAFRKALFDRMNTMIEVTARRR
jgi:hypothetical protein